MISTSGMLIAVAHCTLLIGGLRGNQSVQDVSGHDGFQPNVVGSLVDKYGDPIREKEIRVVISAVTRLRGLQRAQDYVAATNLGGDFKLVAPDARSVGDLLVLVSKAGSHWEACDPIGFKVVPAASPKTLLELGEIALVNLMDPDFLQGLGEDTLKKRFSDSVQLQNWNARFSLALETTVVEMARRGGTSWSQFLLREYEQIRRNLAGSTDELLLLAASRRASSKPDPIEFSLREESVMRATLPRSPNLVIQVTNNDVEGKSFSIGSKFGHPESSWIMVARKGYGKISSRMPESFGPGDTIKSPRRLEPGESVTFSIRLFSLLQLPIPGVYWIRVTCHYSLPSGVPTTDSEGRFVFHTRPFECRVDPSRIRISKSTHIELQDAAAEIEGRDSIFLAAASKSRESNLGRAMREAVASSDTALISLYEAGSASIPVLIERLEEESGSFHQRSRVLKVLWNLTSMFDPPKDLADSGDRASDAASGYAEQSRLVDLWRRASAWFEVEVVE